MSINQERNEDWKIAIIVIAYQGDDWVPGCIKSLQESTQIKTLVLLVDNKDNTGLKSKTEGQMTIHCFKTPRPMGFADANNFALMKVPSEVPYVCFLNQDTISQPNWLDHVINCLNYNPSLGAVTPVLKNYQGTEWDRDFRNALMTQPGFNESWLEDKTRADATDFKCVEDIPATSMVIRTEIIAKTGPFDPIFGSYYEDYDLCMRIRQLGFQIAICPQSVVFHYSGSISQSKNARKRRSRWIIRNRTIHKIRKHKGPRWILFCKYFIFSGIKQLIRATLGSPSSAPLGIVIQANFDLIKVLPRLISRAKDHKEWSCFLDGIDWCTFATKPFARHENTAH